MIMLHPPSSVRKCRLLAVGGAWWILRRPAALAPRLLHAVRQEPRATMVVLRDGVECHALAFREGRRLAGTLDRHCIEPVRVSVMSAEVACPRRPSSGGAERSDGQIDEG